MKTTRFKTDEEMIDYTFRQVLPKYGYKIREPQIELCKQMTKALDNHQISLSEAEVGTGKTFAYIIACIVNQHFKEDDMRSRMNFPHSYHFTLTTPMPYIIATSSIELQSAIVNDYIPKLDKILREEKIISKPITAAIRKGKHNYICEKKLLYYIRDLRGNQNNKKDIDALINLFNNCETDLDNVTSITNYDKRRIRVNNCPDSCEYQKGCLYNTIHDENLNPDTMFQVCNHNYFIADLKHKRNGMKDLLPCYRGVIIDEAHKFVDILNDMYKTKLRKNDMMSTLGSIAKKLRWTRYADRANEIVMHGRKRIDELFSSFYTQVDGEEIVPHSQFAVKMNRHHIFKVKLVASYFTELEKMLKKSFKKEYPFKNTISEIKDVMLSFVCNKTHIYWMGTGNTGLFDVLYSLPLSINKTYRSQIWIKTLPIIFTSGTLSINGDFDYVRNKLGLDVIADVKYDETIKKSPFDYSKNCLIYSSQNTITPKQKDELYIKSLANEIQRLVKATEGRTLVLFTSYRVLNSVYKLINGTLDYPIIVSKRGDRKAIKQFKETTNGILLSTDAWEGVDVEGELLSSLIITKLPFPVPSIDQKMIRQEYNDFFTYLNAEIIPAMQMKLKQGAGRLIRSETDRGVICILDNRYQKETLDALPKCKTTNSINDIKNFL